MTEISKNRKLVVLGAGLVLAVTPLLAACGGSSSSDASPTATASDNAASPTDTPTETSAPAGGVQLVDGVAPAARTITVTKSGFSPSSLTINTGETVTFVGTKEDNGTYGVKVGDLSGYTVRHSLPETFKFTKAGTYPVQEEITSNTATITVQ